MAIINSYNSTGFFENEENFQTPDSSTGALTLQQYQNQILVAINSQEGYARNEANSGPIYQFKYLNDGRLYVETTKWVIHFNPSTYQSIGINGSSITEMTWLNKLNSDYFYYKGNMNYQGMPLISAMKSGSEITSVGGTLKSQTPGYSHVTFEFQGKIISNGFLFNGTVDRYIESLQNSTTGDMLLTGWEGKQPYSSNSNLAGGKITEFRQKYSPDLGKTISDEIILTDLNIYSNTSTLASSYYDMRSGDDTMFAYGKLGSTFEGGGGNDALNGGAGIDTAVYSKSASNYKLVLSPTSTTIQDKTGSEGTDTLILVDRLQFGDRTVLINSQPHGSYADLPDTLYQFFIVGFGAAAGVTYMNQMADAYRYWLPQYGSNTVKQIVEAFTTKTQFTDVYPQALYRMDGGKYYQYSHEQSQPGSPLVRGAEVSKAVFDAQMTTLSVQLVDRILKNSASVQVKAEATADVQAALGLGMDWTIGNVIYTVFNNLANKPLTDTKWGGTAKQFANQVAVSKYYTDVLNQSTDDIVTLQRLMKAVTDTTDVSSSDAIASLIGVTLMESF